MVKRITIRSAKNKGMRLQKYIAKKICDLFNIEFNNQDDNSLVQSRTCGLSGTDIILRGEIYQKFNFDCECKAVEKPSIKDWIKQAKLNIKENRNFLLFWKCKDFKKPVVILDSEIFFEIMKKYIR
jgi:hypothetical protein